MGKGALWSMVFSLSELQAPGKARSLVSMATCLPGWSLQRQPPLSA